MNIVPTFINNYKKDIPLDKLDQFTQFANEEYRRLVREFNKIHAEVTFQIFEDIMKKHERFPSKFRYGTSGKRCFFPESLKKEFDQIPIQADDNCLFHCLTHLNYWKKKHHMYIRHEICNKLDEVIDKLARAKNLALAKDEDKLIQLFDSAIDNNFHIMGPKSDIKMDQGIEILYNEYEYRKQTYIKQMREWGKRTSLGSLLEILTAQIITNTNICVYITSYGETTNKVYENIKQMINVSLPNLIKTPDEKCDFILHLCRFIETDSPATHYEILTKKYKGNIPPTTPPVDPRTTEATAKKKAEEEATAKKKAEEEAVAKKKAEEEAAAKKKAEEEAAARKKAEEEAAARKKAEDDAAAAAKKKAEDDAAAKKKAEEEAEATKKAKEEGVTPVKSLVISDKVDKECKLPSNLEENYTITNFPADGNSLFECLKQGCLIWKNTSIGYIRIDIAYKIPFVVPAFNGASTQGQFLKGKMNYKQLNQATKDFINKHYSDFSVTENNSDEQYTQEQKMRTDKYYGSIIEILIAQMLAGINIILYNKSGNTITEYRELKNKVFTDSYIKEENTFNKVRLYLCNYDDTNKINIHYQLMVPTEKAEEEKRIETAKVIEKINRLWQNCQSGGSKDFKYKYLKYKTKYLTLKNNNSF